MPQSISYIKTAMEKTSDAGVGASPAATSGARHPASPGNGMFAMPPLIESTAVLVEKSVSEGAAESVPAFLIKTLIALIAPWGKFPLRLAAKFTIEERRAAMCMQKAGSRGPNRATYCRTVGARRKARSMKTVFPIRPAEYILAMPGCSTARFASAAEMNASAVSEFAANWGLSIFSPHVFPVSLFTA